MPRKELCRIEGCDKQTTVAFGLCANHYAKLRAHGDPNISLRKSQTPSSAIDAFIERAKLYDGYECLFWPFPCKKGYPRIFRGGKTKLVTRMLCEEAHGPAPSPLHEAAHSCGRGHLGCVTKRHLRWASPKENALDRKVHGTNQEGEKSPSAKLTESAVRDIRLRASTANRILAETYGVKESTIAHVKKHETWKNVS